MTFGSEGQGRAGYQRRLSGWGWLAAVVVCAWLGLVTGSAPAAALKAITVGPDVDRIEITDLGELVEGRGDNLQVETAAGTGTDKMSVRASTPGLSPNWVVFALHNPTDRPIERWLTAERYTVIGSGVFWPDLDAKRIEAVTPSLGFLPERIKSDRADIFRITLEPGQTITYAAELASDRIARIYLWKPIEYEIKVRDRQLFNGIMLGITGVLGIFLTAMFAANHKAIFPTSALVTWCVLAYLCVDFGFWHKLFQLRPEDNAIYRAATEAAMAASFLLFLHMFLRLGAWHGFVRMLLGVWVVSQLALIAIAVIDARLAATFARASFAAIGAVGGLLMVFLALRGQDRALALIPSWMLFLVWGFAATLTLTGQLSGDIVVSGLVAGLVLITVLMGFTVTQFAFRSYEPLYGVAPSEQQLEIRRDRQRRRRGVGVARAAAGDQGEPDRRSDARPQAGRAVDQGRTVRVSPASGRPRALPGTAVVAAGAWRRRATDQFPDAPCGQYVPLVRPRCGCGPGGRSPDAALCRSDARRDRIEASTRAADA